MVSLEEMTSSNLQQTRHIRESLRKTMLVLTLGFKDLEQRLESTEQQYRGLYHELKQKENEVIQRNRNVDFLRASFEERVRDVEVKETELNGLKEKVISDFNAKEKQLESIRGSAEACLKDAEAREQLAKEAFEKIALEQKQFECVRKSIEEREEQLRIRVKEIETKERELDPIEDRIETTAKELDSVEEELEEGEIDDKEILRHDFDLIRCSTEARSKDVEAREKVLKEALEKFKLEKEQFECLRRTIEERALNLDKREEQLGNCMQEIQTKAKEFDTKEEKYCIKKQELDAVYACITNRAKELDCKEKELVLMAKHVDILQEINEEGRKEVAIKEKELESVKKWIEKRSDELDSREKLLNAAEEHQKVLAIKEKEVELLKNLFEKRLESSREKQLGSVEEGLKGLEVKEKELEAFRLSIEKREEELDSRDKQLDSVKAFAEEAQRELEVKGKELESLNRSIEKRSEELDSREKQLHSAQLLTEQDQKRLEVKGKELELLEKSIEKRSKELDCREKQLGSVEECLKELGVKEKELDTLKLSIEKRAKELESREKQLDSVKEFNRECYNKFRTQKQQLKSDEMLIQERSKELDSREKLLISAKEHQQLLEVKQKEVESLKKLTENKLEELDSLKLSIENRAKELDSVKDLLEERSKELDSREQQLTVCLTKSSPTEAMLMDGHELQIYLNKHVERHDSMGEEVSAILKLSPDPGKLVLNAIEGFHPSHLKGRYVEFETSVVRSSCVLLLEQLAKISPEIEPQVKDEAFKLAVEWKAKVTALTVNWLEVLGILYLVAAYNLVSAFGVDEILSLLELVAHCIQTLQLFRMRSFEDKIPDFIKNLLLKDKHILALSYVYEFNLVPSFPPVALLKSILDISKEKAKRICENGKYSSKAQNEAIKTEIQTHREVIKCIEEYGLKSIFPPENIEANIKQLQSSPNYPNPKCTISKKRRRKKKNFQPQNSNHQMHQEKRPCGPNPFQFTQLAGVHNEPHGPSSMGTGSWWPTPYLRDSPWPYGAANGADRPFGYGNAHFGLHPY